MAQQRISLNDLISSNKLDITAKAARRALRKSSLKHDLKSRWEFTPAQAKAAVKALAA